MTRYLQLLALPRFRTVFLAQLLIRLPVGVWPIGILLHVQAETGTYALAGLVVGAMAVGRAIGTPLASRLASRHSARTVIAVTGLGSAASAAALVAVDLAALGTGPGGWLLTGLSALAGLFTPPAQPVVRALYPRLVPGASLQRAFALDASGQEVIFVIGPVLAFGVAAAAGPAVAVLGGAGVMLAGAAWAVLAGALPKAGSSPLRGRGAAVLRSRAVLLATAVGALLVAANSAVEAAVVARFGEAGATGGLLLALYSLASLVGGLGFARWTSQRWASAGWMLVVAGGLALAVLGSSPWWLALALAIAGVGVAPVFAAVAAAVSKEVDERSATEAFGWVDTGAIAGASVGFALAGIVLDAWQPNGGFALAAALAVAGAAVAALVVGPALRVPGWSARPPSG